MASQYATLTICHRNRNGTFFEYTPNTIESTYISSSVNIFRQMILNPTARHSLVALATAIDRSQAVTWYRERYNANQVVALFINHILSDFPVIWVDDTIESRAITGYHPRGQWQGTFDPHRQAVCLNATVRSLPWNNLL